MTREGALCQTLSMATRPRKPLTRADWLRTALRALDKEGLGAVRVLPLAKTLGASRGSFYWHFKDLDDLLDSLLTYWDEELTNTSLERVAAASCDASAKLMILMEDVIERRKGRYDPAIRAWALHDKRAAKVVRSVDRKRISFVIALFREMGFSKVEAEARARLFYLYLLGDHIALEKEPPAKRKQHLKIRHRVLTKR